MSKKLDIRKSVSADVSPIEELYPRAFPDEDLLPLIDELLADELNSFSLVGWENDNLVAHIVFTYCRLAESSEKVALLGPLAVAPDCQRRGIGSQIIRAGFDHLKNEKVFQVLVLGDPNYYGRFGFSTERNINPPYTLPEEWREAWQSLHLKEEAAFLSGELSVPDTWRKPSLWLP